MAKTLNARIITKHDTAENWNKAEGFIPKLGEIIIVDTPEDNIYSQYKVDSIPRLKIGDGKTKCKDLHYITDTYVVKEPGKKLSSNDYSDLHYNIVDEIANLGYQPVYTDTKYNAGYGLGIKNNSFYSTGVVDINNTDKNGTFKCAIGIGPNGEYEEKEITIPGLTETAFTPISNFLTSSSIANINKAITTIEPSTEPGTLNYTNAIGETSSVAIPGLGKLAFKDGFDGDFIEVVEVAVSYRQPTGNVPIWINNETNVLKFYDIASQTYKDIHNGADNFLKLTGGTLTGALNLASGIWNKAGDDCYFGDHNRAGSFGIKGLNGNTNLSLVSQDGSTMASIVFDGTAVQHTKYSIFEAGLTVGSQGSSNYAELIVARKHKDNSNYGRLISCLESDLASGDIIYQVNGTTYSSLLFNNGYLFTPNQIRTNRTGGSWVSARSNAALCLNTSTTVSSWNPIWSIKTQQGDISAGILYPNDVFHIVYNTDENYNNNNNLSHVDLLNLSLDGTLRSSKIYGAVWNDYAEFRQSKEHIEPGYIVYSGDDGILHKTKNRLQHFEGVVSDTFGFAIGETDKAKTPLAVAGRVLVYTDEELHAGDVVCAGENGKASKMDNIEIANKPDRIVGIVSEIPTYDTWGEDNIPVNGRVWIRVK